MNHSYTITAYSPDRCEHNNGWYAQIPRRFWGYRQVFICVDCWSFVDLQKREVIIYKNADRCE